MVIKGFTLIELIIVIGIIALLATTVILVINPARLFGEARDSQRIADLGQMNSAMGLYLATASSLDLDGNNLTGSGTCANRCMVHGNPTGTDCLGRAFGTGVTQHASTSVAVNGTGWIPIDLSAISSGSPLNSWPTDPTASADKFYSYACDNTNYWYEFNANMESSRFGSGSGSDNVEANDGGNSTTLYEVGNDPSLDLQD